MNNYYVLDIELADPDGTSADYDAALDALEDALQTNGMDYFIASDPYANQIAVLIIPEKYVNDTYSGLDSIFDELGLVYVIR